MYHPILLRIILWFFFFCWNQCWQTDARGSLENALRSEIAHVKLKKIPNCFPKWLNQYTLANNMEKFLLFPIFTYMVLSDFLFVFCFCFVLFCQSSRYKMTSYCCLNLVSKITNEIKLFTTYLFASFISSVWDACLCIRPIYLLGFVSSYCWKILF